MLERAGPGSTEVVSQTRLYWGERLVWREAVVEGGRALLPKPPGVYDRVGQVSLYSWLISLPPNGDSSLMGPWQRDIAKAKGA